MESSQESLLTGRIKNSPNSLLHELILQPQFTYEMENLLPWYIWIEKVTLLEYQRMGLMDQGAIEEIARILSGINRNSLTANPEVNMSDIAFAIEKWVMNHTTKLPPTWHIDRSRNDFQATAQVMFGREVLFELAEGTSELLQTIHKKAEKYLDVPMPGYTHYQPAQVITPGFYLLGMAENTLNFLYRLLVEFDGVNKCPLGTGAMAGQELDWDRDQMAKQLGFVEPIRHALVSVASRDWVLRIGGELSHYATVLSRFITDLIFWGSSDCGYIDLPDRLSGISSSMPQKKNFPILERLRGKTAHISSFYVDFLMGQRSTAYTNLVETSKEAGMYFVTQVKNMKSILQILNLVMENLSFHELKMREACEREFLGGFSLANALTLQYGIPYRTSQVISGRYIMEQIHKGSVPSNVSEETLVQIGAQFEYDLTGAKSLLKKAFDIEQNILSKSSMGGAHPVRSQELLHAQQMDLYQINLKWEERRKGIQSALQMVEQRLQSKTKP